MTAGAPLADLRYRLTAEDCVEVAEFQLSHSPAQRRSLLLNAATGSVLVVALVFALRLAGRPVGWVVGFVAVVGWLVYLPWRLRIGNRRQFRRHFGEAEAQGFMGEHRLAADGGGVTVQNRIGSSRIVWAGIQRIATGPGFAVFELSSQNMIIVPARGILEGDLDAFVELSRRLRAEAGAAEA